MLAELRVEGLGIIDELTLVLSPGLTAITGETGAGKTLLVEAVELLVGGRADSARVRRGAPEARVEGRFVDSERDEEVVLARVVPAEGRSRAYVDGRLAAVGELAAIGTRLVDLHGQHAHQSLLDPAVQRAALDRFAGPPAVEALAAYRAARAEAARVEQALGALGGDGRARARELDLLRYQVDEIEAAGIRDPGEDAALEAEEVLLADAASHREALLAAQLAVEGAVLDGVGAAAGALAGRPPFADLEHRARALQAELAELGRDLRTTGEAVVVDPGRLDDVQARRRQLRELGRKYGETLEEVIAYGGEAARRISELEGFEERAAALEREREEALDLAERVAGDLRAARRAVAEPLAVAVEAHLRELAMPAARFVVEVEPGPAGEDGADRVAFLLSANAGEPPGPLTRVASGGELSRAMLAVRLVLAEAPPTLVFDEVDAGLGGEAGVAVGRLLAELGRRHQVLCVTHLAQVAAFADLQVEVTKEEAGGRTATRARPVAGEERVVALSRMLAGLESSAHARAHAQELLTAAQRGTSR